MEVENVPVTIEKGVGRRERKSNVQVPSITEPQPSQEQIQEQQMMAELEAQKQTLVDYALIAITIGFVGITFYLVGKYAVNYFNESGSSFIDEQVKSIPDRAIANSMHAN